MNVLIACEESQAVCKAFRAKGHNAFSNDLKECSGGHPEWHIVADVLTVIDGGTFITQSGDVVVIEKWDFIGLHPDCTKMTVSGNRTYAKGKPKHYERIEAINWTVDLWLAACNAAKRVYMENPMGAINSDKRLPKPQIVQPYYFGDEYSKKTCLWLCGLPKLFHSKETDMFYQKTHVGKGEMIVFESGKSMPKWYADAWKLPRHERQELRSKTFPSIAAAMANQWG